MKHRCRKPMEESDPSMVGGLDVCVRVLLGLLIGVSVIASISSYVQRQLQAPRRPQSPSATSVEKEKTTSRR